MDRTLNFEVIPKIPTHWDTYFKLEYGWDCKYGGFHNCDQITKVKGFKDLMKIWNEMTFG